MPNESISITILMSVYNSQKYIEQSIISILDQTFVNFEFIIINDGSTDSSFEKIKKFNDKRISVINNKANIGLSASLNKGIRLAKGKYIARMDADDISLPDRLEKQYKFMEQNENIGILGTGYVLIDKRGKELGEFIYPVDPIEIRWKLLTRPIFPHPTVMLRKAILLENNLFYNEEYSATQDYELWSKIINYTNGINLPEALLKYRNHENSKSKIDFNQQDLLKERVSAQLLNQLSPFLKITNYESAIICKIINLDFSSLDEKNLERVYLIFFSILNTFNKKYCSSHYLKNNWHNHCLLPLITKIEKLLINKPWNYKNQQIIYIKYLFKLSFFNISMWFKHLFLEKRRLLYYPYWLYEIIKYFFNNHYKLKL